MAIIDDAPIWCDTAVFPGGARRKCPSDPKSCQVLCRHREEKRQQDYAARMAIVEVMKGRLNVPEIDVVIDDRRLAVRAGGEWLLALPGAGTRFVPACGVYAVRVTGGSAVGQIESIGSDQRVPLERIRAFNRE